VKLKEETEEREEVCSVVATLRSRRRSLGQCWEGLDGGGELGMAPEGLRGRNAGGEQGEVELWGGI
jgi:hypothetical protein